MSSLRVPEPNALDRAIEWVAPQWAMKRALARVRVQAARAYYDGASLGRRTAGIRRSSADATTVSERDLTRLRQHCRDLARNNPYAVSAVREIKAKIGVARPHFVRDGERAEDLHELAKAHLETTECDSDGLLPYEGLQGLATKGMAEGGGVLIRRRWRRLSDGFAVPVQFQLLEPEYLDWTKDGPTPGGGEIIHGVEFDAIGRRRAYHLYRQHPGSLRGFRAESRPVPARDIAHVFRVDRPGQVDGIPWGAPVLLRVADTDDYEDAQVVRQKVAACFAGFVTESFDTSLPGSTTENDDGELIDSIEPGMMERLPLGSDITFADPPGVENYEEYMRVTQRGIAAGYGIAYESMTGDLKGVSFSSGKMGRLDEARNVHEWQRDILIPRIAHVLTGWFLEAAMLTGVDVDGVRVSHTVASGDMVDPTRERKAERDAIRAGQKTLTQAIQESGRDPREHFEEYARDLEMVDELGIVLDSDPRQRTAAGNEVGSGSGGGTGDDSGLSDEDMDQLADLLASRNGVYR